MAKCEHCGDEIEAGSESPMPDGALYCGICSRRRSGAEVTLRALGPLQFSEIATVKDGSNWRALRRRAEMTLLIHIAMIVILVVAILLLALSIRLQFDRFFMLIGVACGFAAANTALVLCFNMAASRVGRRFPRSVEIDDTTVRITQPGATWEACLSTAMWSRGLASYDTAIGDFLPAKPALLLKLDDIVVACGWRDPAARDQLEELLWRERIGQFRQPTRFGSFFRGIRFIAIFLFSIGVAILVARCVAMLLDQFGANDHWKFCAYAISLAFFGFAGTIIALSDRLSAKQREIFRSRSQFWRVIIVFAVFGTSFGGFAHGLPEEIACALVNALLGVLIALLMRWAATRNSPTNS